MGLRPFREAPIHSRTSDGFTSCAEELAEETTDRCETCPRSPPIDRNHCGRVLAAELRGGWEFLGKPHPLLVRAITVASHGSSSLMIPLPRGEVDLGGVGDAQ